MKRALLSKNKFKFVDGTITMPDPDEMIFDDWERYRFSKGDHFRMSDLLQELHSIKQGDRDISKYFTGLKTVWEDLEVLRSIPSCTCAIKCKCRMVKIIKEQREYEYVICFLKGLNDEFTTTRSQILLLEPLPSINKAFSLLQQQERQLTSANMKVLFNSNMNAVDSTENTNRTLNNNAQWKGILGRGNVIGKFKGRGMGRGYNTNKINNPKVCTYCGKERHTADVCYYKHGFPPNFGKQRMNHAGSTNMVDASSENDILHTENKGKPTLNFSPAQYAELAALFNNAGLVGSSESKVNQLSIMSLDETYLHKDSGNIHPWILDSGPTDHVCPCLSSFMSYQSIKPVTIKLPNGSIVSAKYSGIVKFSEHLLLHKVLFVLEFKFNLISIHKLASDLNCRVIFDDSQCMNQDINTLKMIGHAKVMKNLYILGTPSQPTLKKPSLVNSVYRISAFDLWHYRLGHPSVDVLQHICKDFSYVYFDAKKIYEFCHLAKQTKLPFPISFCKMVKVIRTNNGIEFKLPSFFDNLGIIHQTSCVETPQQNSVFERKHRHLLNVTRSMLFHAHLPNIFWSFAVQHAAFIINKIPTQTLQHKSPYEMLYESKPNLHEIKVFGCLSFASTLVSHHTKLDARARKCILLGFKTGVKGYVLFDLKSREIFISRNVQFYEDHFPYHHTATVPPINESSSNPSPDLPFLDTPFNTPTIPHTTPQSSHSQHTHINPASPLHTQPTSSNQQISPTSLPQPQAIRKSTRICHPPSYLHDFHCNFLTQTTTDSSHITHPLSSVLSYSSISQSHLSHILSISTHIEPKSYAQAINYPEWITAMQAELIALASNETWDVVDLPTVRLVLAIAASENWFLNQLDVNNAFLHGELKEDVYMLIPQGVVCSKPNQVCKLRKSLYGLKQASREWYQKLSITLKQMGYTQSPHDHSLFTKKQSCNFTVILIYVDDLILGGNDVTEIAHVKHQLHTLFQIKDLGSLKYFLGIEVARSSKGITLSQRKYALDILNDTGFLASKPAHTPIAKGTSFSNDSSGPYYDPAAFRRLVGRLLYLTNIRPDISFSVQQLSQFMNAPTNAHHQALTRILRYLKKAPGQGIFYPANYVLQLKGFSDSDWKFNNPTSMDSTPNLSFAAPFEALSPTVSLPLTIKKIIEKTTLVNNKQKTISDAFSANVATTEPSPTQSPASITNNASFPPSHPPYRAWFPSVPSFHGPSGQIHGGSRGGGRFGRHGHGGRSLGRSSVYFCDYCNKHGHDVT
ncbi:PREDICTED: uncharacterized protein LOC109352859 [Lupinus angustifolius]|uniref:uncharacterized protein LOC109352859 n=1 Tax=Lupinus angustifolius TaxID=3871 RepID=UPI00092F497E|nr:PREDICTED: uncharacterized protein LOC109352859 [Lupinus angustifolius]